MSMSTALPFPPPGVRPTVPKGYLSIDKLVKERPGPYSPDAVMFGSPAGVEEENCSSPSKGGHAMAGRTGDGAAAGFGAFVPFWLGIGEKEAFGEDLRQIHADDPGCGG